MIKAHHSSLGYKDRDAFWIKRHPESNLYFLIGFFISMYIFNSSHLVMSLTVPHNDDNSALQVVDEMVIGSLYVGKVTKTQTRLPPLTHSPYSVCIPWMDTMVSASTFTCPSNVFMAKRDRPKLYQFLFIIWKVLWP